MFDNLLNGIFRFNNLSIDQAKQIRKKSVEHVESETGKILGLKCARGLWTPKSMERDAFNKIPATIYFSDVDDVCNVKENMDIDNAFNALIGLPPDDPQVYPHLLNILKDIHAGRIKRVVAVTAHGDELTLPPVIDQSQWVYLNQRNSPHTIDEIVFALKDQADVLFIDVCNIGRKDLINTPIPVFYAKGEVNTAKIDNEDATLCFSGPSLLS